MINFARYFSSPTTTRAINYSCPRVTEFLKAAKNNELVYSRDVFLKARDARHEAAKCAYFNKISENTEAITTKISRYLKILPKDSKMKKPSTFELNGKTFEMFVSKNAEGNSKVTIKRLEKDLPHDSHQREDSTLDIVFDNNNQMISGHYTSGNTAHSCAYTFERSPKNVRRIHFEESYKGTNFGQVSYMPQKGVEGVWNCIEKSVSSYYRETPYPITQNVFKEDELGRVFFDLTQLKRTL